MIQNNADIYKLIKSNTYRAVHVPVTPEICDHWSYELFNTITPSERVSIYIYPTYMEIYKLSSCGTEYYENIRTTNKRGKKTEKRLKDLLLRKNIVAAVQHINSL